VRARERGVSQPRWRLRRTPRRFPAATLGRRLPLYLRHPDEMRASRFRSLRLIPRVSSGDIHAYTKPFVRGVRSESDLRRSSRSCRLNARRRAPLSPSLSSSLFLSPSDSLLPLAPLVSPVPPATTHPPGCAASGVPTRTTPAIQKPTGLAVETCSHLVDQSTPR